MKKEIRLLGIDDSPFSFNDKYTTVIGIVMRGGTYIEGAICQKVTIDGSDSTNICKNMINNTRHKKQLRAVLIDGVALGGFNVIDIEEIYMDTGIPVITVTRDEPDFMDIKNALKNNFENWEYRFNIIKKNKLIKIATNYNPLYIKIVGISNNEAKEIIKLSTIRGVIPEPIRVAHIIASCISRGESYGKA